MRSFAALVAPVALAAGAALAGCGLLLNLDGLSGGGGGGAGGATTTTTTASSSSSSSSATSSSGSSTSSSSGTVDAGDDAEAGIPYDGGPLPPVKPPVSIDAGTVAFIIDATEVTVRQYQAFVKSFAVHPFPQRDACMWNQSVVPNDAPPNDAGIYPNPECSTYDLDAEVAAHPDAPVRCVHWCDAATYCTWVGGHMCQGDEGKPYPVEWQNACQGPHGYAYPYGNAFDAGTCVDSTVNAVQDVASKPACQGGYPGVFDMSGNVGEWLDCGCEYDTPVFTQNSAYVGGGSFDETGTAEGCTPQRTEQLVSFHTDVGIRCCYGN
jgi:formylglycine-generating enzyme